MRQSHSDQGEAGEIATLPLVARNDKVTSLEGFVMEEGKDSGRWG